MRKKNILLIAGVVFLISGLIYLEKGKVYFADKGMAEASSSQKTADKVHVHQKKMEPGGENLAKQDSKEGDSEDKIELARMNKELSGNIYLPVQPGENKDVEREKRLAEKILLEIKVKNNTATKEEKVKFLKYKIKSVKDKSVMIEYIISRTSSLSMENGKSYLSEEDVDKGRKEIAKLGSLLAEYQAELENLKAE